MKKLSTKQKLRAETRRRKLFAKEIKRKPHRAMLKARDRKIAMQYRRALKRARLGL